MVQTMSCISQFSWKWRYAVNFSIFSEETAWCKPGTLFLYFLENDIRVLSSQFSLKQQPRSNQIEFCKFSDK